ncbi:MAG: peptide deformylase [Gammaproteobacteria bacterium]|nr:peptide deformylase [Gammaproteobacteria bacterium]MCW8988042.1 peptide deformylase [Gammaproteobacteria bacterium]MCW9031116.1 peptide deformylase [Gammaproteobacteria bacterium]
MAALDIITYPDARLKQVAEEVTTFDAKLMKLIQNLEETMAAGPAGVGIAATQVGVMLRVVIVDVSHYPRLKDAKHHGHLVLVNPEILDWQGMKKGREGCMSVPDFTGNVIRADNIVLKALDQDGVAQKYEMEGFEARAVQHEIDHLDGLLFLDRLVSRRNDLFKRKNN